MGCGRDRKRMEYGPSGLGGPCAKAHAEVREVAKASGATVIIPGNIYAYGDTMPEVLDANTPQLPSTRYGEIAKTWRPPIGAMASEPLSCALVTYDELGNWFDRISPRGSARHICLSGPHERGTCLGFLPDMARAAVALAEKRDELARSRTSHILV